MKRCRPIDERNWREIGVTEEEKRVSIRFLSFFHSIWKKWLFQCFHSKFWNSGERLIIVSWRKWWNLEKILKSYFTVFHCELCKVIVYLSLFVGVYSLLFFPRKLTFSNKSFCWWVSHYEFAVSSHSVYGDLETKTVSRLFRRQL